MAGVNIDSDENVIWSSSQSMENTTPGRGLTNVSRVTTHTIEAMQTNGSDEHMPTLLSDSDSDDEATWNNLGGYSSGSSDTSDGDYLFNGNLSDASDDSSIADDDDEYGVFEMLSNHFDVFNNFVPAFFGVSLQMLYTRIMENITLDEERESPTPQHILDLLPSTKVTVAQVASNLSCCICFCDYILNEELLELPCSHIYHRNCILDWLKIKCTCPTCRNDLTTNINHTTSPSNLTNFNTATTSSTENLFSIVNNRDTTIYNNIDTSRNTSEQNMSTTTPDIVTVSVGNISDVPTMASSNLTNNNNSSNSNSTTSSSRTYTQNITNRSTIVTHFGTTNGSHGSECSSNSNTVEMEAGQSNFSSNVKSTKRFSRETEIW